MKRRMILGSTFPHVVMSYSIRLPDAMPDVSALTLLVVCDAHQCRLLNLGGHALVEKEVLQSQEPEFDERQNLAMSPSGSLHGVGEINQVEENRLKKFATVLVEHLEHAVRDQKIESVHLSAPGKFLSIVRDHLTPALTAVMKKMVDGNFVKEQGLELLVRFRPDLSQAVADFHNQESYSPGNQPPRK